MPRLLFEKMRPAVYISHLDLMRVFQRAFRRGGLLIHHSQGFSPRAVVSIALPLSVGTESVCELLDFDLEQGVCVPLEEIQKRLNRTMPAGIRVLDIWEKGKKLRELTHLDAELILEYDAGIPENALESINDFFCQSQSILVPKKTKSGMTDLDIRPMIQELALSPINDHELRLYCRVCAQNPSLNPALLGTALTLHLAAYAPNHIQIKRLEVLDASGQVFR